MKPKMNANVQGEEFTKNTSFRKNWVEYKDGFGNLCEDFWLGNERIHQITSNSRWELRIDMVFKNTFYHSVYSHFSIMDESNNYTLKLKRFLYGNGEDMLAPINGMAFSTRTKISTANHL
ncbi:Ficolin-1 [Bulinus truncatus]|nr:Ficolin-1 [Bulinus truncatus]